MKAAEVAGRARMPLLGLGEPASGTWGHRETEGLCGRTLFAWTLPGP